MRYRLVYSSTHLHIYVIAFNFELINDSMTNDQIDQTNQTNQRNPHVNTQA